MAKECQLLASLEAELAVARNTHIRDLEKITMMTEVNKPEIDREELAVCIRDARFPDEPLPREEWNYGTWQAWLSAADAAIAYFADHQAPSCTHDVPTPEQADAIGPCAAPEVISARQATAESILGVVFSRKDHRLSPNAEAFNTMWEDGMATLALDERARLARNAKAAMCPMIHGSPSTEEEWRNVVDIKTVDEWREVVLAVDASRPPPASAVAYEARIRGLESQLTEASKPPVAPVTDEELATQANRLAEHASWADCRAIVRAVREALGVGEKL